MLQDFSVIVIGAGHAGCEAAAAAARLGMRVALITFKLDNIGELSCNPSIGGVGKGIIVKEIDALDGVMPIATDRAMIHYKTLNRSRGPAVWGPRAQVDRDLYRRAMRDIICNYHNLEVLLGEVKDLLIEKGEVIGVVYRPEDGGTDIELRAKSVVLTSGTFLGGVMYVGSASNNGGRYGERPSNDLAVRMRAMGLRMGRLKTGTPARLLRESINYAKVEEQSGEDPIPFSCFTQKVEVPQISCYIAVTNPITHDIIRNGIDTSAIYSGAISSSGPRYCPSIEDKVVRFAHRERHQVFLEPEGIESDLVYPSGISTSLAKEVQEAFIRSISGLENVEIVRFGYAIEYDYVDPRELSSTLEMHSLPGLFLAGQINGTTGYEEAAGQGIIAGINAGLKAVGDGETYTISRGEGYIGVMINDLIRHGVSEPYRMMTSRAEFRLSLRPENADQRLTERASALGIISKKRLDIAKEISDKFNHLVVQLSSFKSYPHRVIKDYKTHNSDGQLRSLLEMMAFPGIDTKEIWSFFAINRDNLHINSAAESSNAAIMKDNDDTEQCEEFALKFALNCEVSTQSSTIEGGDYFSTSEDELSYQNFLEKYGKNLLSRVEIHALYNIYSSRQASDIQLLMQEEDQFIPEEFEPAAVSGLSNEVVARILQHKPRNISDLRRMEGITPAAVIAIQIHLKKLTLKSN